MAPGHSGQDFEEEQKVFEGLEQPLVTTLGLLWPPKPHLGWPDM